MRAYFPYISLNMKDIRTKIESIFHTLEIYVWKLLIINCIIGCNYKYISIAFINFYFMYYTTINSELD